MIGVAEVGAERVHILRDLALVVSEGFMVTGAELREENLVLSFRDQLLNGFAAFHVDLLGTWSGFGCATAENEDESDSKRSEEVVDDGEPPMPSKTTLNQ